MLLIGIKSHFVKGAEYFIINIGKLMDRILKLFLVATFLLFTSHILFGQSIKVKTYYSEDWDNWQAGDYRIKTAYSEDWDNWEYKIDGKSGKIKTYYSEDWDNWEIKGDNTLKLKTYYSEDWDNWKITGDNVDLKATTMYSEDWDNWKITGSGVEIRIKTYYSEDWDNWEVRGDLSKLSTEEKAAIFFIPIFVSSIHNKEINK